jgi:hypothetical protein
MHPGQAIRLLVARTRSNIRKLLHANYRVGKLLLRKTGAKNRGEKQGRKTEGEKKGSKRPFKIEKKNETRKVQRTT